MLTPYTVFRSIHMLKAITALQPKKSVVGVCLEGDTTLRLETTAKLYHTKKIHQIIVSGGVDEQELDRLPALKMMDFLISNGVPKNKIELEEESEKTIDHPLKVSKIAKKLRASELLIITSGYHLLRAYLTFLKQIDNQKYPFNIYGFAAGSAITWFRKSPTEGSYRFLLFLTELVKIQKYKDDLVSPNEAWKYLDSLKNPNS